MVPSAQTRPSLPAPVAGLVRKARNNLDLPVQLVTSALGARADRGHFDSVATYCMFIGYPRSGHSLVGSLLDAHPDAVVAHELDALRLVQAGFRRNQVFSLILRNAQAQGLHRQHVYDYSVPNQWQGRFRRIKVIGDKKGGRSTRRLAECPDLLTRLERLVGVPTRFVHVVRNPFDNIATMFLRHSEGPSESGAHPAADPSLTATIDTYTLLCDTVATVKAAVGPAAMLDLRHEDLLRDPATHLSELTRFVGLEAPADYLGDCAGILYTSPNRTRDRVTWTRDLTARVQALVDRFDFLAGYSLET